MSRTLNPGAPCAVAAMLAALAVPGVALSQALEEVVVTAERRETNLQDTPISIIAFQAETLEARGIEDLGDLALFSPNLAINGSRGNGNNQPTFSIRGISGGGGVTSERGVALYIDNIYVPRTNGSVFKVFDIERIEVLRGPQGTLFGRNSTGGAVRIFTKQPGPEFESYLRATVGNFDRHDISGMVNVPVSDRVSLRAQAAYLHEDGYVRRGPQKLGSSEDWLGRIQAAIEINDNVKLTLGGLYSDSKSDGSPNDFETFDMQGSIIEGNFADWLSDALASVGAARLTSDDPRIVLDDYTMPDFCLLDDFDPDWDAACEQKNDNQYSQVDAKLEWQLSEAMTLISTSGWAKLEHVGLMDWQLLGTERRPDDVESTVFFQEFQLNTPLFDNKVDLVTGINFYYEDSESEVVTLNRRGSSSFNPMTGVGSANGDGPGQIFSQGHTDTRQKSNSWGWFNSATWHVTDKFNFTAGARLAYDRKDIEQTRFPTNGEAPAGWSPAPGTTSTTVNADDSWTEVDWRATLDYHFSEDFMAYATASKAYRAGQYSLNILPNVPGELQSDDFIEPIPPEKVISYELGVRATFLDGRLRVNPTGFFMQWSSRQAARQIADPTQPVGFRIAIVDSGDVDVYGLELDAQLAVTDNLTFDGSLGITSDDVKNPVANSGPNLFPAQPSPSYNFGATYARTLESAGRIAFNVNWAYVGDQPTHPTANTDSDYQLPSYDLVNARVQWVSPNGRNVISLFGNNLLDDTYATYATRFGGGFWDHGSGAGQAAPLRSARSVVRGRPREYGITLQHNF